MEPQSIKRLVSSSLLCLLPAAVGSVCWNVLPERFVRQLTVSAGYAFTSKAVVVFVLPAVFLAVHLVYCRKPDWLNLRRLKNKYWPLPLASNAVFALLWVLSAAMAVA